MEKFTLKHIDEFDFYKGEKADPKMLFIYAGQGLGVTAWGMNIIKMLPHCETYPEHDHVEDGQEEVYIVLDGSVTFKADDKTWQMEKGMMVRVSPDQKRKFVTEDEGVTLLAIGAKPGEAYKPKR